MFKIGDKVISDKLLKSLGSFHNLTYWQPNVVGTIMRIDNNYDELTFEEDQSSRYSMSEFKLVEQNNYLQAGPIFKVGSYVQIKDTEENKKKYHPSYIKSIYKIIKLGLNGVYLDAMYRTILYDVKVDINDLDLYNMTDSEIQEYLNKKDRLSDKDFKPMQEPLYQDTSVIADRLQEILDKQSELQNKLNINPKYMSFMDKVRFIQSNMTHVNIEFAELLRELPFKYWKKYTPEQLNGEEYKTNRKKVVIEYIDMLCFFINIGLALDITSEELYSSYMEKNDINFKRQENKY
jgi:dimeric dUTPase (all-alpha-NTP-PPase superfamily)